MITLTRNVGSGEDGSMSFMSMRPLNVLIVDDELPLRQELRMFPWEDCNAVLIGEASNGEEALRICETFVPDVVITDITMPVMDGIILIRELKKRYPIVQIILLTCHSEFHYAQEALRIGALEYMLKATIDEQEMKRALDKVRQAVAKERKSLDNEKSELRQLQAALFEKLLQGHPLQYADWSAIQLDGQTTYVLVLFMFDAPDSVFLAAQPQMEQMFSDMESSDSTCITWLTVRKQEYFVMMTLSGKDITPLLPSIEARLQQLESFITEEASLVEHEHLIQVVISEFFASSDELVQSVEHTTLWKEALFYDRVEDNLVYYGHPQPLQAMTEMHMKEMTEILRKAAWNSESLVDCMKNAFFEWCMFQRVQPEQLKQYVIGWFVEWINQQGGGELLLLNITSMLEVKSLSRLINIVCRKIIEIENGKTRSRHEIRLALQWIKDNMKQPISLPIIAEQVGLSPQYVSRLFREETGTSVTQYITQMRMEKAVELLKQTNMKVYEIAEEVGIPSYRYFTVMFRNWTGVSPTDYKRKV
jgi:two-component system response regulator YesN